MDSCPKRGNRLAEMTWSLVFLNVLKLAHDMTILISTYFLLDVASAPARVLTY